MEYREALVLAGDPNTDPDMLNQLLHASYHQDWSYAQRDGIRRALAEHRNVSPDTLRLIWKNTKDHTYSLVRNPNTPPDVLLALTQTLDKVACKWACIHPSTPYGTWARRYGRVLP